VDNCPLCVPVGVTPAVILGFLVLWVFPNMRFTLLPWMLADFKLHLLVACSFSPLPILDTRIW
jgi:hypothetical protein